MRKTADTAVLDSVVGDIQDYLRFLKASGGTGVDLAEKGRNIIRSWDDAAAASVGAPAAKPGVNGYAAYLKCTRCGLSGKAEASVFGAGPRDAKLMFVGGIPEKNDGNTGLPYTGPEGELLGRIIAAMKRSREEVYICPAVKCRPPGGRMPGYREADACRYFLLCQIEAIRPAVICVLGEGPARMLLGKDASIGRMRGRFYAYDGIPVMPTFDPAHLLAEPSAKRPVWEDMQAVMKIMDTHPPSSPGGSHLP